MIRRSIGSVEASSINGPVGATRGFGTWTVPLGELREIEHQLGGTVNDALLSIVAGGLRRLLLDRDDTPLPRELRAMVPVDLRDPRTEEIGNHISALFVPLDVSPLTAEERHDTIVRRTERAKHGPEGAVVETAVGLSGLAPPLLQRAIVRLAITPRLFHLTVTNVRGPRRHQEILGAPLRTVQPFVPLGPEHRVGVALTSYAGSATVGVAVDADHVPDLDVLLAAMRTEHVLLRRAARRRARARTVARDPAAAL